MPERCVAGMMACSLLDERSICIRRRSGVKGRLGSLLLNGHGSR